mmetsp:Transcript_61613/g.194965  ORF Transcript_61613/g.194965 Transcript_61613/m.194965 type:complete len:598 (-) Transcript_61613:32-1825(-)
MPSSSLPSRANARLGRCSAVLRCTSHHRVPLPAGRQAVGLRGSWPAPTRRAILPCPDEAAPPPTSRASPLWGASVSGSLEAGSPWDLASRIASGALAIATAAGMLASPALAVGQKVLPNAREMDAIMSLYQTETGEVDTKSDMYTEDAWAGIKKLREYGAFVETLQPVENSEACMNLTPTCKENRLTLEKAFQVVSNEFYDVQGKGFSQAKWAETLLSTLRRAGGVLPSQAASWAAAEEMVASLGDKYSEFLEPDDFNLALRRPSPLQRKYLAAQYTGVGLELQKDRGSGELLVVSPFAASPAEEGGVKSGERIVSIDGYLAAKLTLGEATGLMRGPPGTTVELDVRGDGATLPVRRVVLERRRLPQPPVKQALLPLGGGEFIGYLRLHYFSSDGRRAVQDAVSEYEARGGVVGYILDLRNNPGGVFEEAVAISSMFSGEPEGTALLETMHDDGFPFVWKQGMLPKEVYEDYGLPDGPITRMPIAVLVNRGSASASEVLAGSLRGLGRATLLGEETYGKGVVQYYFPTGDGSGIKLTVMKYVLPGGYDISQSGPILPDEVCRDPPQGLARYPDRCVRRAMDVVSGRVPILPKAGPEI